MVRFSLLLCIRFLHVSCVSCSTFTQLPKENLPRCSLFCLFFLPGLCHNPPHLMLLAGFSVIISLLYPDFSLFLKVLYELFSVWSLNWSSPHVSVVLLLQIGFFSKPLEHKTADGCSTDMLRICSRPCSFKTELPLGLFTRDSSPYSGNVFGQSPLISF